MLTIVFGAGASYDSCPSLRPPEHHIARPPLADELFESRFDQDLSSFPELTTIVPLLRHRKAGATVEEVLEDLRFEAGDDPTRAGQLLGTRFYLQSMLSWVQQRWGQELLTSSSYLTLLETIRPLRKPPDPVCLVTFNYDRFLDVSLRAVYQPVDDLPSFISGDYKLFKLHGSTNWGRRIQAPPLVSSDANDWGVIHTLEDHAQTLDVTSDFLVGDGRPLVRIGDKIVVPAIAAPLGGKVGYECPEEHVSDLRRLLPSTTTLILIGWRALDRSFMDDLDRVTRGAHVVCVSGSLESGQQVAERMDRRGFHDVDVEPGGFSEFVLTRRVKSLLDREAKVDD